MSSDKWIRIQHDEIRERNRRQREQQAAVVADRAARARNRQEGRS